MHLPRFSFSSDGLLDMVLWSYPEAANPSAEVVVVVESAGFVNVETVVVAPHTRPSFRTSASSEPLAMV